MGYYIILFTFRYLEDRRPAANMDPYLVCSSLVDATIMNGKNLMTLIE